MLLELKIKIACRDFNIIFRCHCKCMNLELDSNIRLIFYSVQQSESIFHAFVSADTPSRLTPSRGRLLGLQTTALNSVRVDSAFFAGGTINSADVTY